MQKKRLYLFTKAKFVVLFANMLIEHVAQGPSRGDRTTSVLTRVRCALCWATQSSRRTRLWLPWPTAPTVQLVFGMVFPVFREDEQDVRLPQGER